MTEESKQVILRMLISNVGGCEDNLYKVKAQFKYYTVKQMNSKYGESSQTCQQILNNYEMSLLRAQNLVKEFKILANIE